MGVKGLMTYIEKKEPNALMDVDVTSYKGKSSTLVLDGNSTYFRWYDNIRNKVKGIHLGTFPEFTQNLEEMFVLFNKRGIKCVVIFDGAPSDERENSWIKRRKSDIKEIEKLPQLLARRQQGEIEKLQENYLCLAEVVKHCLRFSKHATMMQSVLDADTEITSYVKKNENVCYGVLTNDTDFIISNDIPNVFLANHLDSTGTKTKRVDKSILADNLGIKLDWLPLFATLNGNDITSGLLKNYIDSPSRIQFRQDKVGLWMKENLRNKFVDVAHEVAQKLGRPQLEAKLRESLNSYTLQDNNNDSSLMTSSNTWNKILKYAEDRHRHQNINREILSIMTRSKYHAPGIIEFYYEKWSPSGILLGKLRKRLYGILLKERPTTVAKRWVTEFVVSGPGSLDNPKIVDAELPNRHPGLLNIWNNDPHYINEKLRLVYWAVSPNLDVELVISIPAQFRIAALSLYYLLNEVSSGMDDKVVKSLVDTIVTLPNQSFQNLQAIPTVFPDKQEIHFSSQYCRTWWTVLAVDDACGNPLLAGAEQVFYHGKLFNEFYHGKRKITVENADFRDTIIKFLYRS